jgi:hypothetical protein
MEGMADQSHFDDPERWRERAAEIGALVNLVSSHRAKAEILRIAAEYEALADMADARARDRRGLE